MRTEVSELLKDPVFMEKIMNENDKEKVKELFWEKGIELSSEELDNVGKEIYDSLVLASKLSEDETANVSGGDGGLFDRAKKKLYGLFGLPTAEEEQALHNQIEEKKEQLVEWQTPDTQGDIIDRNKGKLMVGAVAVTLCAVYGVKNIKRYLKGAKKKKNWINNQKSEE